MLKITDYGFTQEEATNIAFGLALYDNWTKEVIEGEFFDDRYNALIKDFADGIPFAQALVSGFLGGFSKGLEVRSKVYEDEETKPAPSDSNTESGQSVNSTSNEDFTPKV